MIGLQRFRVAARASRALALGLALAGPMAPAHAGLFDDDEARKAILDLRAAQKASEEAQRVRLEQLQQALDRSAEDRQQLRRSLLDLSTQIEQLRADNRQLRGQQEQLQRDVADLQRQLKTTATTLDARVNQVEPQKVQVDGREFVVDPAERRAYEQAVALMRDARFTEAGTALQAFLARWPSSGYAPSARYWLGNAQFGARQYKESIATFRALASAPNHPRAAEALLSIASAQTELKDARAARRTLEELLKAYPSSEAAAAARERLERLK